MKNADLIHVGTSGWHYEHWKGPFYPSECSADRFLEYYAEHFHTVEINNSFYHLPAKETLNGWYNTVPADFIFAVKASRYITHMKKLKDPVKTLLPLLNRVEGLRDKLGPILFQLPPNWKINIKRLELFLKELPKEHRYAFEFRDTSWFDNSIYEILQEHDAAFCIYHLAGTLSPKRVTSNTVYVRLHGPGDAYQGQYDSQTLAGWVGAFSAWSRQGRHVYCYFDNDESGYAPQDALRLQPMLD